MTSLLVPQHTPVTGTHIMLEESMSLSTGLFQGILYFLCSKNNDSLLLSTTEWRLYSYVVKMLSQFSFTEIQSWFQLTPTLTASSMPDLVPPWPVLALLTPETHQCWLLLVLPTSSQYDQFAIK